MTCLNERIVGAIFFMLSEFAFAVTSSSIRPKR